MGETRSGWNPFSGTFMAEGFDLGQLICFQQDFPCSDLRVLPAPQQAGVCWHASCPVEVCQQWTLPCVPTPPLPRCRASPSLLLPTCLPSSSSPAFKLPMGCCDAAQRSLRVGKSLVLLVFKTPINIIGSWEALRCLTWNVSC